MFYVSNFKELSQLWKQKAVYRAHMWFLSSNFKGKSFDFFMWSVCTASRVGRTAWLGLTVSWRVTNCAERRTPCPSTSSCHIFTWWNSNDRLTKSKLSVTWGRAGGSLQHFFSYFCRDSSLRVKREMCFSSQTTPRNESGSH